MELDDGRQMSNIAAPFAPGNPKLREKHLARRAELLRGALEIVGEDGLPGLTIARLAKKMGSATGALYRYFPGKDELVAGLQHHALHAFSHSLVESITALKSRRDEVNSAVYALALPLGALLTWRAQKKIAPDTHALLDAMLSAPFEVLNADAMAATEAQLCSLFSSVASLFDDATTSGVLHPGDNEVRVRVAWACLHGMDHMHKRDRVEPPERQSDVLAREMLFTLFCGWGASRENFAQASTFVA